MSAGANTTDIGIRTIVINNYAKLISDKKLYFRDSSIYIHSANDGYLDLEADIATRINSDIIVLDTLSLKTGSNDDDYFVIGAKDNGVDIVEVARVQGANEPFFQTNKHARKKQYTTLGAAATTFAITGEYIELTGDVGTNTIATITGGVPGQLIILEFVDALITITDDNTHVADSVDLSAAFTGADDTILILVYNGTSWYEVSRSVN